MALPIEPDDTPLRAPPARPRAIRLRRLVAGEVSASAIAAPVLVSRPGCAIEELDGSLVHALGALAWRAASEGLALPYEVGRLFIGRTDENDIIVEESTVSRRHATLVLHDDDRWSVIDESSLNGTWLDGERLPAGRQVAITGSPATLRFGLVEIFSFMDRHGLDSYVRSLQLELDARRTNATNPGRATARAARLPLSTGWESPIEEYLAARILDALRTSRGEVRAYEVRLDGGETVTMDSWAALVAFVERNARRIHEITTDAGTGPARAVYVRK